MLKDNNICKFVTQRENPVSDLNTVNFVRETSRIAETPHIRSVYALHLVTEGRGVFSCGGKEFDIEKGDMFFTRPSSLFAIKNTENLEYAYVSFLGLGAAVLLRRIFPSAAETTVFGGNAELIDFWERALDKANSDNVDLLSKSVLEYSAGLLIASVPENCESGTMKEIEKYVGANFTDPELSLKSIAARFGYNEKYLSKLFFRFTGNYFSDYLVNLRINAACGLVQEGASVVKQIAYACGFVDPLYFSKVFKSKMNCTPSEFIASARKMPEKS